MAQTLNKADIDRLMTSPSAEVRAETAGKVADAFSAGALGAKERAIAEDIFRALVRDAELRVREALSQHIKEATDLPRDVALALAKDADSVATPMLEHSEVFTDDDLLEIVATFGPAKQVAVAKRAHVSGAVSDALVETGNEDVVVTLVENDGADIAEPTMQRVVDDWGENERLHAPLVGRAELPISVAERLVSLVSERLQDRLVAHHDLPADTAADLALQSRERATIGLATGGDEEVRKLVDHLAASGRLTATLLLRALCMGDLIFFEYGMARLAGIGLVNMRVLINDSGELGMKSLYSKAALPAPLFDAFRVAVDVSRETTLDGGDNDHERHSRRMIERILTQYEDIGADNLDYLLNRLGKLNTAEKGLEKASAA